MLFALQMGSSAIPVNSSEMLKERKAHERGNRMLQKRAGRRRVSTSAYPKQVGWAAMWCVLAIGLSGAAPTGPKTLNEALRPMMVTMLLGAIAIVAIGLLGAVVVASLKRPSKDEQDANSSGRAGHSTYMMSLKRAVLAFACVALPALALLFFPGILGGSSAAAISLALLVAGVAAFKLFAKRSDQAERGADAEVVVAQLLRDLPKEYHVFHDLVFEGFNIDHVVIGPTGVFIVETKSHGRKVSARGEALLLNGRAFEKPILKQARSEALTLRDRLPRINGKRCSVHPILCFPNAFIEVRGLVKGVTVAGRHFLTRAIIGYRAVALSQPEILQLVDALKLSASPVHSGRG
jgi:hypothetical protein